MHHQQGKKVLEKQYFFLVKCSTLNLTQIVALFYSVIIKHYHALIYIIQMTGCSRNGTRLVSLFES